MEMIIVMEWEIVLSSCVEGGGIRSPRKVAYAKSCQ